MRNDKYALILALGLAVTSSAAKAQSENLDNAQITDKKVIHLMKAIDAGAQADWGDLIKNRRESGTKSIKKIDIILKTNNSEIKDVMQNIIYSYQTFWQKMCHAVEIAYSENKDHGERAFSQCSIIVTNDFIKLYDEFFDDPENRN